jgi:hypothetical protein
LYLNPGLAGVQFFPSIINLSGRISLRMFKEVWKGTDADLIKPGDSGNGIVAIFCSDLSRP